MRIACICPTCGRPPKYQYLVEEVIESFLRQDCDDAELIVYNDCAAQTLVCDAPGVRIINVSEREPTLGDKYNAMIRMTDAEFICPWEDDDISLSWRISQAVDAIGDCDYWTPGVYWTYIHHKYQWQTPMGYAHNCSMYRRDAWEKVGGYPSLSGPQDAHMHGLLLQCRVAPRQSLPPADWAYIYRWGVSPCHLSAFQDKDRVWRGVCEEAEPGVYKLDPHWREDYTKACLDALS